MSKTSLPTEQREFLRGLGLDAEAPGLVHLPETKTAEVVLAPPGVDPRRMPVDEIKFDPHLLDQFPSLEGDGQSAAANYVFALYKSYGRDKHRNSTLWREIGKFIVHTRRQRETGGLMKEKVKTTKNERDLAALLASQGVDAGALAEALSLLATKKEEGKA